MTDKIGTFTAMDIVALALFEAPLDTENQQERLDDLAQKFGSTTRKVDEYRRQTMESLVSHVLGIELNEYDGVFVNSVVEDEDACIKECAKVLLEQYEWLQKAKKDLQNYCYAYGEEYPEDVFDLEKIQNKNKDFDANVWMHGLIKEHGMWHEVKPIENAEVNREVQKILLGDESLSVEVLDKGLYLN